MVEDYLYDEIKKNTPQARNGLNELIRSYSTVYGNNEPVGLNMYSSKIKGG